MRLLVLALMTSLFWMASAAVATTVTVSSVDLNDALGPSGDLWQLDFDVSGRVFDTNEGFSIYFDPTLYASLVATPLQPSPDWDVLVLQPDPALPADGVYDALRWSMRPRSP